jgi:copper chaperone
MKTLNLPGMTCGGCARSVTAAIKELDQDAEVTVDIDARRVTIETTASDEALREAVREAGYTPA